MTLSTLDRGVVALHSDESGTQNPALSSFIRICELVIQIRFGRFVPFEMLHVKPTHETFFNLEICREDSGGNVLLS